MTIFRSLQKRFSQSLNSSPYRTFFSLSFASHCPLSTPISLINCNNNYSQRHFLFHTRFLFPVSGPLFLSNPPWKLSQSATPLLLQSNAVRSLFKLRALNLLHRPTFSYNLGCGVVHDAQKLLNESGVKEFRKRSEIDVAAAAGGVTDNYLNLPNYISFARLLSGPLIGWMITHDMYSSAFIGLAISGASDWLDGYVARKMGINSVVGSYLDPLADKVLIGCVALAMVDNGLLHPGLVSLVVFRDVALVGGAVYKRASSLGWEWKSWSDFFNLDGAHAQKVEPLLISKVNTVFQLVLVAAALLQPGFGNEETQIYINYLSWLVVSTTVASTAAYGAQHMKNGTVLVKKFGR